jgi:hypothetical protein
MEIEIKLWFDSGFLFKRKNLHAFFSCTSQGGAEEHQHIQIQKYIASHHIKTDINLTKSFQKTRIIVGDSYYRHQYISRHPQNW